MSTLSSMLSIKRSARPSDRPSYTSVWKSFETFHRDWLPGGISDQTFQSLTVSGSNGDIRMQAEAYTLAEMGNRIYFMGADERVLPLAR